MELSLSPEGRGGGVGKMKIVLNYLLLLKTAILKTK